MPHWQFRISLFSVPHQEDDLMTGFWGIWQAGEGDHGLREEKEQIQRQMWSKKGEGTGDGDQLGESDIL